MQYIFLSSIVSLIGHAYYTKDKDSFNSTDKLILWFLCTMLVSSGLITLFDIQ
jgi:hypothetical protein